MKILITGATGAIGNSVGRKLFELGHELFVVSRSKSKAELYLEFPAEIIEVDLSQSLIHDSCMDNIDAVIHLMGETIDGRWTAEKKQLILESRTKSSQNLIQSLKPRTQVVVSASAQGFYGDQGRLELSETALKGTDFLADVCEEWEKPFRTLDEIRSVQLRIGLVLDPQSGALKKMIPLFQKGLGGVLGSGEQYMSWIALDDLTNVVVEATLNHHYNGPLNCSANSVTNREWTVKLCQSLGVFKSLPVPQVALKLILGEMSSLVLSSIRMSNEKLRDLGFNFKYTNIDQYFFDNLNDFKDGHSVLLVRQYVPFSLNKVFPFFAEAKNLERITPDLLHFRIEKMSTPEIQKGTLIDYNLKIHGFPAKWKTLIEDWQPPVQFVDTQLKGPYKLWHHTHSFAQMGKGTLLTDKVRFKLPLGFLGHAVAQTFVQKDVESIFKYRREVMSEVKFSE